MSHRFVSSGRGLALVLALGIASTHLGGCVPLAATGAGVAAMSLSDRRTTGTQVEDQGIELRVANAISERFGSRVHVNVTAFNRYALLTGEVPDDATGREVQRVAEAQRNVRGVTNELRIGPPTPFSSRSNDVYLAGKVKARLVDNKVVSANHVKVVVENSEVFLMGLLTTAETDKATEIARTTGGIRKVTRVVETITPEEARTLDHMRQSDPGQAEKR